MPRRRMIDPDFWSDSRIKKLPPVERLFFLGMISHADDEGRLQADPAYLRSKIFPYDDFSLDEIREMRDHIVEANPNVKLYENSGEEYLYFRKWSRYQKPSHPQPSKLPKPPQLQEELQSDSGTVPGKLPEREQNRAGMIPSQSRLGQSSLGKVRIGQVSGVQEDFTEFLNSEGDLTDLLTMTLTKYRPRGPLWLTEVLKRFWEQCTGKEMSGTVFQVTHEAVARYPPDVLARAYVKAARYSPGKTNPAKYLRKVLEEKARPP